MTTTVEFPGLGLEFEINRVAFTIGDFPVYWYGIIIGFGLALAMVWAFWKSKEFGVDGDKFIDAVIVGAVFGVFGARLFYVLFSAPGQFNTIGDFFDFRNGGLVFYGALIFGILAAYLISRWRKIKFFPLADLVAVGFMIGQCVGRWGNFVNQEAFGSNTDLPWGMFSGYTKSFLQNNQAALLEQGMVVDPMAPVHPTFLYESIWLLIGFILISFYIKRRKFDGEIFLMYVAWNGFGRAFIEGLRTDSMYLGSLRVSQVLAIVGAITAIAFIVWTRIKIMKSSDEKHLLPYAYTDEWAQEYAAVVAAREAEAQARENKANAKADGQTTKSMAATAKTVKPKETEKAAQDTKATDSQAAAKTKPKEPDRKAIDKSAAKTTDKKSEDAKEAVAEEQSKQAKKMQSTESVKDSGEKRTKKQTAATAKTNKPEKEDSDPALPTGEIIENDAKAEQSATENEQTKAAKKKPAQTKEAKKTEKQNNVKADASGKEKSVTKNGDAKTKKAEVEGKPVDSDQKSKDGEK